MFNIGFWELFLIVIVGLLVIGPKQLPEVAKSVARTVRRFRRTTDELRESAREVVHEVIPPEDLYGYGDDEPQKLAPANTTPLELPPPSMTETSVAPPPVDEGPRAGDSSVAS
jgi:sec-independent protein translocase protein TatB